MCRITGYSSVMPLAPRMVRASRAIVEGLADVVQLAEADLLGAERSRRPSCGRGAGPAATPLLSSTQHVRELLLGELEPADRLAELLARLRRSRAPTRSMLARRPWRPRRCRTGPRSGTTAGPAGRSPGQHASARAGGRRRGSARRSPTRAATASGATSLVENPGVSVGTMNPRTPSSVRAHTIATSAMPPLVIHIFVPLSTQSSPSRWPASACEPGSLPLSGSVRPKQPIDLAGGHAREPLLLLLLRRRTSRSGTSRASPGR